MHANASKLKRIKCFAGKKRENKKKILQKDRNCRFYQVFNFYPLMTWKKEKKESKI